MSEEREDVLIPCMAHHLLGDKCQICETRDTSLVVAQMLSSSRQYNKGYSCPIHYHTRAIVTPP